MTRRRGEDGFALIGAVWLLMLGAAIVALLMFRAHDDAVEAKDDAREMTNRAAAVSALHTVATELLLLGPRSRWATTPTGGELELDGVVVRIALSSEEGRVDVNSVGLDQLDTALRQLGLNAAARRRFILAIERRRQSGRPYSRLSEIEALAPGGRPCLADTFTAASGLAQPRRDQASEVGGMVGQAGSVAGPRPQPLGVPLRMMVTTRSGRATTIVFRVTPTPAQPLLISEWRGAAPC